MRASARPRRARGAAALVGGLLAAACGSSEPVPAPPPRLVSLEPNPGPGGRAFLLVATGAGLADGDRLSLDGVALSTERLDRERLRAELPPSPRGIHAVRILRGETPSEALALELGNAPPRLELPGRQLVGASATARFAISASDLDADPVRLALARGPAGSRFDPATGAFEWQAPSSTSSLDLSAVFTADDGRDVVTGTVALQVRGALPDPSLDRLEPNPAPGGRAFELVAHGAGLTDGDVLLLDGQPRPTRVIDRDTAVAELPALPRGRVELRLRRGDLTTPPLALAVGNAPPSLAHPGRPAVDEEEALDLGLVVADLDDDPVRVFVSGLPPGAVFDEAARRLRFTPDFTQGGRVWTVHVSATDGEDEARLDFELEVRDSIAPAWPRVVESDARPDHLRLLLEQTTDDYLDPPERAGRTIRARVVIPASASAESPHAIRVFLHGFGGSPFDGGLGDQFRIYPHDPDNTYWWGYATGGEAPPHTARRVLHLLDWVRRHYPGADAERAYVSGSSMGGAGAFVLGLLWSRHFAAVDSSLGQAIALNHRPSRRRQLAGLWGDPDAALDAGGGLSAWERQDLSRALLDEPAARDQFVFSRHGKDDATIHFGAAVMPSPRTGLSLYEALAASRTAHFVVWDEGGHGPADPRLGASWWDDGWDRIHDPVTFLRRDRAHVAFGDSSADDDPGDGSGNGRRDFHPERGYAGEVDVVGDTGWTGDRAGARGRYLRWDARALEDTPERFRVPLRAAVDPSGRPGVGDDPPSGDTWLGPLPILADVTPRRVHGFRCLPDEPIEWSYGALGGTVRAGPDGTVTVPRLPIGRDWEVLSLVRSAR